MESSTSSETAARVTRARSAPPPCEDADWRAEGESTLPFISEIIPDSEDDEDLPTIWSMIAKLVGQAPSQPGDASPGSLTSKYPLNELRLIFIVAPTMTTVPNTPRAVSPENSNGAAKHSPCSSSAEVDGASDDSSSDVSAYCGLSKKRSADRSPSVASRDDELTVGDSQDDVSHKRQKFA